ncbi:hypothetical protein LOK49_LG04G01995 [Camellia lanceoleosa]|uniref:Uncharacterized protein n=1 Tax=Camellia lanceoleosa TaxID=1840588 RepID=A0ACC0HZI8_9ERIC|nr:hypothetical protein LOK49_LG04G01995 [Camellia lanceoleosa]
MSTAASPGITPNRKSRREDLTIRTHNNFLLLITRSYVLSSIVQVNIVRFMQYFNLVIRYFWPNSCLLNFLFSSILVKL